MMMRKQFVLLAGVLSILLLFAGCRANDKTPGSSSEQPAASGTSPAQSEDSGENLPVQSDREPGGEEDMQLKMKVQIGSHTFMATLENNAATAALWEMLRQAPVVLQMRDYSGFEKVGSLGRDLPTSDSLTTTYSGDIVLYNGNQIVLFYGSNTWSYTRLGKIDDLSGWNDALGGGDVTVTFSAA